jgi:hypothetical protein
MFNKNFFLLSLFALILVACGTASEENDEWVANDENCEVWISYWNAFKEKNPSDEFSTIISDESLIPNLSMDSKNFRSNECLKMLSSNGFEFFNANVTWPQYLVNTDPKFPEVSQNYYSWPLSYKPFTQVDYENNPESDFQGAKIFVNVHEKSMGCPGNIYGAFKYRIIDSDGNRLGTLNSTVEFAEPTKPGDTVVLSFETVSQNFVGIELRLLTCFPSPKKFVLEDFSSYSNSFEG